MAPLRRPDVSRLWIGAGKGPPRMAERSNECSDAAAALMPNVNWLFAIVSCGGTRSDAVSSTSRSTATAPGSAICIGPHARRSS